MQSVQDLLWGTIMTMMAVYTTIGMVDILC